MNDRINEGESDFDAFREWLDETAAREGTSPDSVLSQLMSTYWILTELSDVIEETPYVESETVSEVETPDDTDGDHRAIVEVIESIAEMNKGQSAPEPQSQSSAIDPGVIQLIDALKSERSGGSESSFGGASEYRLEKLRDEVEDLERNLRKVEDRSEDLDDTLDKNARNLARLRQDVAGLEQAVEQGADADALHALEDQVDSHREELSGELDATEERFEAAYANIKRILEYLLGTTERNAERIDAIVDVLVSAFEDLAASEHDSERLAELKRDANRRGIQKATCDSCEHTIDLSLLAEPTCPGCDRPIEGFEKSSDMFRSKQMARTRADRVDDVTKSELVRELRSRLDRIEGSDPDVLDEMELDDDPS